MTLMLNGSMLSIAQLGPDFLLLRETADHPPAEATIVMNVDGNERRWKVALPDGIVAGSERVSIAEA